MPRGNVGAKPHGCPEKCDGLVAVSVIYVRCCENSHVPGIAGCRFNCSMTETNRLLVPAAHQSNAALQHNCASHVRIDSEDVFHLVLYALRTLLLVGRRDVSP